MRVWARAPGGRHGRLLALALLLATLLFSGGPVRADEQPPKRVLKVAYAEVPGFSETDEYGVHHGIIPDYLNEIAKYTGWEYEYIATDGDTMTDEFIDGDYDLMGGTYYHPSLEQYFAYPDFTTGYAKSVLMARRDDESINAYDWKSMNGKTIGVYERAEENIRRLKLFLTSNDIDCTIKYYTREQMTGDDLYPFLGSGEVDMLLGNNAEELEEFRVVAEFDAQPHYIVTTPGNQQVLDGLNMAMGKIVDSNPNFAKECYEANFPDSGIAKIFLNEAEKAYIRQKKTVSVAVVDNWHPLFCLGNSNDLHNGLVPDVLGSIKDFTGLEFTYVQADSYAQAMDLVQAGEADMLGAFLGTAEEGVQAGLALTKGYAALNDIIARNKSVSFPSDGLVGAVLEGRKMPKRINAAEVHYYKTVNDALAAVNRGEIDFFYGLSTRIEQTIQEHHYANVVPNTLVNDTNDICFAMISPARVELLTIFNKAINSMSQQEKASLANQNMISVGVNAISLEEMIYADPIMFVSLSGGAFLLLAFLVLAVAHSRIKATRLQSNLEKAEAANRAKGEFLSRMSHEIRTPMNAIVGLSDLTCMMDEVPENIRTNLTKIRSSSHYLLSLISDILDMSRIENGMMTIDQAPFSLGRVMDELKSMMTGDAKRRGLTFEVKTEFRDDLLVGDAVRLKQVLMNLISNAFKFTSAGGAVSVYAIQTDSGEEGAVFRFGVTDSGVGISAENQKRIFEAFEQVGPNYAKSQGTGLGLAISKTIVQMMGGELCLRSEPGTGSEFYFTAAFPVGTPGDAPEELPAETNLDRMSILLAEDNDLNAEIAMELLHMQGAYVRRAENGQVAVEMFRDSEPGEIRAILMDIQMPVMNGLEACRAIRGMERPDAAKIPIIAMTANSFKEDEDAAALAGMNGFVPKPVDVDYLYRVLRGVMTVSDAPHEPLPGQESL